MRLRLLVVLASSFSLNTTDHHQKYSYCVALGADQRDILSEWETKSLSIEWFHKRTVGHRIRKWKWSDNGCASLSLSLKLRHYLDLSGFRCSHVHWPFFFMCYCVCELVSGLYTHFVWSMGSRDNQKRFVHKIFQAKKWFMPFSRVSPFLLSNCSYAAAVNPHGERTMPICTYSMSIQIYNREKTNGKEKWNHKTLHYKQRHAATGQTSRQKTFNDYNCNNNETQRTERRREFIRVHTARAPAAHATP